MATSPVNHRQHQNELHHRSEHRHPNPIHNLSFAFPKWGSKSHVNTVHRSRRSSDPPPPFPQEQMHRWRRSSQQTIIFGADSREADEGARRGAEEDGEGNGRRSPIGSRTSRNRVDLLPKSPEEKRRSQTPVDGEEAVDEEMAEEREGDIIREEAHRLWNLRPRKCVAKNGKEICGGVSSSKHHNIVFHAQNDGGDSQDAVMAQQADAAPKSLRLRGMMEAHGGVEKKKERPKLWISLSKEEIEEDIFILTGSRPARRPKRRPKCVQKQLDILFPGLTLVGASAETFKIPDSPPKR